MSTNVTLTPLFVELHRWARLPFIWGEHDCALVCFDWVRQVRGIDPGAHLRLTYGSAGELQRLTGFFTDPEGVIAPLLKAAGIGDATAPVRGDIGLLAHETAAGSLRPHMGLCLGEVWAVKAEVGVTAYRPSNVLRTWAVGYVDP